MKIQVTQKHIDEGVKKSSKCCPIALALRNHGFVSASVGSVSFAVIDQDGRQVCGSLPLEAERFVKRFDLYARWMVKPFEFELEVS